MDSRERTFMALEHQADARSKIVAEQQRTIDRLQIDLKKRRVQIRQLKAQVDELENQIENLKKVDLRIEEKNRRPTPQ